jgi:superfamily II DNA/RNA helicase
LYAALAGNKARNDLMCVDLLRSIKAGRSPILLTERTSQVDEFASRLTGLVKHIVVLKGGMGAKQRRAIAEQLTTIPDGEERVLLATGRASVKASTTRASTRYSCHAHFCGTLQQYVGRLHRSRQQARSHRLRLRGRLRASPSAMHCKRVRGYEAVDTKFKILTNRATLCCAYLLTRRGLSRSNRSNRLAI